jgi:hypothetical protein
LRRSAAVLLGGLVALLGVGGTAGAALLEPVTITASAPETATAGTPFKLEVAVEAEPGQLAIAAQPLKVRVKLASECGGSFAGTPGPTALEQTLPAPAGSAPYKQTVSGSVTVPGAGTDAVCAFLEDAQERQFATDTEAEITVVSAGAARQCTAATKQLTVAKRKLKRLEHRIKKVKRTLHKAHGKHRVALARKLHKLQADKRKAAKRRKVAEHRVAGVCP